MVYGAEAVLPHDLRFDAPRVVAYDEDDANEALEDDVDLLDEARDIALARTATTIAVDCAPGRLSKVT